MYVSIRVHRCSRTGILFWLRTELTTQTHTATHSFSLHWDRGENLEIKNEKNLWIEKKTVYYPKKSCTPRQSKTRDSFSTSPQQAGIQLSPGKQGHITLNIDLRRQTQSLQMSRLPPYSPTLYTEHEVTSYGIFLWPVGISCPDYVTPNSLCNADSLLGW